jgi:septal ring factor EnvC (AmiA/AmiB activator)
MRKTALLTIVLLASFILQGQTKEELQNQRQRTLNDIKLTNELISKSKRAQQSTQGELELLNKQIQLRKDLMRTISREVNRLEKDINVNKETIRQKEEELKALKEEYGKLIYLAYKNNSGYDKMMYIFASDDFYQAWRRMRYLKDVAAYRQEQSTEIVETKALLIKKNEEIEAQKKDKLILLDEQKSEQASLDKDRKSKESALADLKSDEKGLKEKLKTYERKQRELNQAIEKLIAEELKRNRKADAPPGFSLTPEEELSASNFTQNKGKLPWPVERGVVTSSFGTHAHPVLPGIQVTNNGIDIATESQAMVRALFEGEVSGIIEIPGQGLALVLKHGSYRTVYSNLKEVMVAKGQMVETKQRIGVLIDGEGRSEAHLEIWQVTSEGMKKLDPSTWIAR